MNAVSPIQQVKPAFAFTQSQQQAIEKIDRFLSSDDGMFVLSGFAGTGKTTLMAHLVETWADSMAIAVCAPTHKALDDDRRHRSLISGAMVSLRRLCVGEEKGLVISFRDHKNRKQYELTEDGEKLGEALDTAKKHGDGTPVKQIKWYSRIIDLLKGEDAA